MVTKVYQNNFIKIQKSTLWNNSKSTENVYLVEHK